jgi:hypothetical protein
MQGCSPSRSDTIPTVFSSFIPAFTPRCLGPVADHSVDDDKFVGIVSRFELSDLELDRLVDKTGTWRTAFGIWMRWRNVPIFG